MGAGIQGAKLEEFKRQVRYFNGVTIENLTDENLAVLYTSIKRADMLAKTLMYFFERGSKVNLSSDGVFSNEQGTLKLVSYKWLEKRGAFVWTDAQDQNMSKFFDYDPYIKESFYVYEWRFKFDDGTTAKITWDEIKTPADKAEVTVKFADLSVKVVLENVDSMNDDLAKTIVKDICECLGIKGTLEWMKNLYQKLSEHVNLDKYFYVAIEGPSNYYAEYIDKKLSYCFVRKGRYNISYSAADESSEETFKVSDGVYNSVERAYEHGKKMIKFCGEESGAGEIIMELVNAYYEFLTEYGKI